MQKQTCNTVLMIEPTCFGYNAETAATNSFQNIPTDPERVNANALSEFQDFVSQLKMYGVDVIVKKDHPNSTSPDSIFPNNWFSTHAEGKMILYPMAVPNRRLERKPEIIEDIRLLGKYEIVDLTYNELDASPIFLEGTGSMIFDHPNKVIYAAISNRTDTNLIDVVADILNYSTVKFKAFGKSGELIYHTNVMLCIGVSFAVVGLDTVAKEDKDKVYNALKASGKELIEMSNKQIYNSFAGNMLQLTNKNGEHIIVMSKSAYSSLNTNQVNLLKKHNDHFVTPNLETIEFVGGGSARCMLAEIFIP